MAEAKPGPEAALRDPLPPAGVRVPALATFAGLAGVPILALGHNSLTPLLRLYPEEVEFRVFRRLRRSYAEIRRVEVMTSLATRNVELVWRESMLTFTANVKTDAWRLAFLRLLEGRGVDLAPSAWRLLEEAGAAAGDRSR